MLKKGPFVIESFGSFDYDYTHNELGCFFNQVPRYNTNGPQLISLTCQIVYLHFCKKTHQIDFH
jgi:hypothetical protein